MIKTGKRGLHVLIALFSQPQPQYRQQVFGVQQQIVGPRGQITARPMAPGNTQNQPYDEVPNYDYLDRC